MENNAWKIRYLTLKASLAGSGRVLECENCPANVHVTEPGVPVTWYACELCCDQLFCEQCGPKVLVSCDNCAYHFCETCIETETILVTGGVEQVTCLADLMDVASKEKARWCLACFDQHDLVLCRECRQEQVIEVANSDVRL